MMITLRIRYYPHIKTIHKQHKIENGKITDSKTGFPLETHQELLKTPAPTFSARQLNENREQRRGRVPLMFS